MKERNNNGIYTHSNKHIHSIQYRCTKKKAKRQEKKQNLFLSLHFCINKQATGKTKQKRNRQTLQLTPTHSQAEGSKTKTTTKLILKKSKKTDPKHARGKIPIVKK